MILKKEVGLGEGRLLCDERGCRVASAGLVPRQSSAV
jgi:hypothetical protein